MIMPASGDLLESFIKKILDYQDDPQPALPPQADLLAIAQDLGMSEEEWETFKKEGDEHYARGKNFLKYNNFEDALKEFQQAFVVDPYRKDLAFDIASVYGRRWEKTGNSEDKKQANIYARYCLQLDARHEGAAQWVSRLSQPRKKGNRFVRLTGIILGVVVGIPMFLIILVAIFTDPDSQKKMENPQPGPAAEESLPETPERVLPPTASPLQIPLSLEGALQSEALLFTPTLSTYNSSFLGSSYKLQGYITLNGIELQALRVQVALFDSLENKVHEEEKLVLSEYKSAHRPEDVLPFSYIHYVKKEEGDLPPIKNARVKVVNLQQRPFLNQLAPSPEKSYEWAIAQPSGVNIRIRERLNQHNPIRDGGTYHKLVWEITNTGAVALKQLKLTLTWPGDEQPAKTQDTFVLTEGGAPFLPGQTFLQEGTFKLATVPASGTPEYEIRVASLKY